MQTTKILKTVFFVTVLLGTMATASQAQSGCPFRKKSVGNTIFQKILNNKTLDKSNSSNIINNLPIGTIAHILSLNNIFLYILFKRREMRKISLSEKNQASNLDLITGDLNLSADLRANKLLVSHPEAPGGDLDVTTNLTYQEKAEEKVIALTK